MIRYYRSLIAFCLKAAWRILGDGDVEGTSGDVLFTPFYHQGIISLFFHVIADAILLVAQMLYRYFLARNCRSMDADQ